MWIPYILLSAVLLAFYDVGKKKSVQDNSVMSALVWSSTAGLLFFTAMLAATGRLGGALSAEPVWWLRCAVKSVVVGLSWVFMYYALRMLPVSLAIPIRASAPLWTLVGAIVLFGEVPTWQQAGGMVLIFTGYWLFAVAGRRDGIRFFHHGGIACVFAATLFGAASTLYDKYLFGTLQGPRETIQLGFAAGLVVFFSLLRFGQRAASLTRTKFEWRWVIPVTGILLILSDFLYFRAVGEPGTQIAVISLVRRTSVVVSFSLGVLLFKEKHIPQKVVALCVLMAGVVVLCLAS